MSASYLKRSALGLITFFAASLLLGLVPGLFDDTPSGDRFFYFLWLPAIESSVKVAVAAFAGACVARGPFVLPAIAFVVVGTIGSWHLLVEIAAVVQPTSLLEVAARNSFAAAMTIVFAVAGAELGTRWSVASKGPQAPE